MKRGQWTKPELPAPGARAARGQEATSNGWGEAARPLGLLGELGGGGREPEERGAGGTGFCLLLWTRKHEPVCGGSSPETRMEPEWETVLAGRSHGRAGEGGRSPPRQPGQKALKEGETRHVIFCPV